MILKHIRVWWGLCCPCLSCFCSVIQTVVCILFVQNIWLTPLRNVGFYSALGIFCLFVFFTSNRFWWISVDNKFSFLLPPLAAKTEFHWQWSNQNVVVWIAIYNATLNYVDPMNWVLADTVVLQMFFLCCEVTLLFQIREKVWYH